MCYTSNVEKKYKLWSIWSNRLQRWGLRELAASFLEAAGPVNLVLAQFVHIAQPVFHSTVDGAHLQAFSDILEDRTETRSFIAFLREGMIS